MAGPFPGMDPYLEFQAAWPDFHNGLIAEIRNELARAFQNPMSPGSTSGSKSRRGRSSRGDRSVQMPCWAGSRRQRPARR